MRKIVVLHPHPFAELLPMMSGDELHALCEDISANGQRESIAIFKGLILDGRNRYAACAKLGIEPITHVFKGSEEDALRYVSSRNIQRRNLTDSQKAAAAVKFLPEFERVGKLAQSGRCAAVGESRELAGRLFGVSGRYVGEAKRILKADPKLFDDVFNGNIAISEAKYAIRRKARLARDPAPAARPKLVRISMSDENGLRRSFTIRDATIPQLFKLLCDQSLMEE